MAGSRPKVHKVGKKRVGKKHRKTKIVPEHLMGKSLHKKVGRKQSRRK